MVLIKIILLGSSLQKEEIKKKWRIKSMGAKLLIRNQERRWMKFGYHTHENFNIKEKIFN